jgi:hypothetical protein
MLVNQPPGAMQPSQCFRFRHLKAGTVLTLSLLLAACSSTPPAKHADAPPRARTIAVGEVTIVDEAGRFVLVDLAANLYLPPPGMALRAINAAGETTAHLKAAPERKRPFIAADIVDGHPAVGDLVVQ